MVKAITTADLQRMKADGAKIVALTAWDYFSAVTAEAAGADLILVGDSLAMTVQGETDTLAVTLDEMIRTKGKKLKTMLSQSNPVSLSTLVLTLFFNNNADTS